MDVSIDKIKKIDAVDVINISRTAEFVVARVSRQKSDDDEILCQLCID